MASGDILRNAQGDVLHKPSTDLILRYGAPQDEPKYPPESDPGWWTVGYDSYYNSPQYSSEPSYTDTKQGGGIFEVGPAPFDGKVEGPYAAFDIRNNVSWSDNGLTGDNNIATMTGNWEYEYRTMTYAVPYNYVGPPLNSPLRCTGLFDVRLYIRNIILHSAQTSEPRAFDLKFDFFGRTFAHRSVMANPYKQYRVVFTDIKLAAHINSCMDNNVVAPYYTGEYGVSGVGDVMPEYPYDFRDQHLGDNKFLFIPTTTNWTNIGAYGTIASISAYFQ